MGYIKYHAEKAAVKGTGSAFLLFLKFVGYMFVFLVPYISIFFIWGSSKRKKWEKVAFTIYTFVFISYVAPMWVWIPLDCLGFIGIGLYLLSLLPDKTESKEQE